MTDEAARINSVLLDIAKALEDAKSPWDGDDIDGETVFFGLKWTLAGIIRSAVQRSNAKEAGKKYD